MKKTYEMDLVSLDTAKKQYLPALNFVHSSSLPESKEFGCKGKVNHTELLTLNFDLFNKGQKRLKIKAAKENTESSEMNLKSAKTEIFQGIKSSILNIISLASQIQLTEIKMKLAGENYEIVSGALLYLSQKIRVSARSRC